ncbi:MAG: hypothetical protein ACREMY_25485, partial [bacterium]
MSRVQPLTALSLEPCSPQTAGTLELCRRLWSAGHMAAIEAAADELVGQLLPGVRARILSVNEAAAEQSDPAALRLPLQHDRMLELRPVPTATDRDLLPTISRLIDLRLTDLEQHEELTASVLRLEEAERLQRALYAIADQASANQDINETLRALHGIVGSLMYAENLYIVLYDSQRDTIRFAYFADVADPDPPDPSRHQPMEEIQYG